LTRLHVLLSVSIAILVAALLAGCDLFDGDGDGEDPQQVLEQTFSGDTQVDSAVIDVTLTASAGDAGSLDASIDGPVQGVEGEFPQFDLAASVNAEGAGQSFDFEGGVTSTGDAGFVNYQGTDYEVPSDVFNSFSQAYQQSAAQQEGQAGASFQEQCEQAIEQAGGDAAACDIDFAGWLTNLQNEGGEDVEGTETTHISGDADISQIVEDLRTLASSVPGGEQIPTEQLQQVTDAVTEASIDVFSGTDDRILRRLELALTIEPPEQAAAVPVESVNVDFSVTLSEVNEEQTVDAPTDTRPLSELLDQLGISGLLGQGLGGPSLGGLPSVPETGSGGTGGANEEYLNCVAEAKTPDEFQACSETL
jgi:hypothetical protein